MSTYIDMPYNDLKKLVAERNLKPENLSKESLVKALEGADGTTTPGNTPPPDVSEPAADGTPTIVTPALEKKMETVAAKAWNNDVKKMKAHLDAQPKVNAFIPFNDGESPQQGAKIPFIVNLNGLRMEIPRGVMVQVPQQVYEIIRERLESEGRMGIEHRIDGNSAREEALL